MKLLIVALAGARRICMPSVLQALTFGVVLVTGCGDFGGPRSGTESGNPINPPAPPAQTETVGNPTPSGDPTFPNVDPPMIPDPMPTAPDMGTTRPSPLPLPSEDWPEWPGDDQDGERPEPKPSDTDDDVTEPPPPVVEPLPNVTTPNPAMTDGPTTAPTLDPSMVPAPPSAGDSMTPPDTSGAAGGMCSADACLVQANNAAVQFGQPRPEPAAFDSSSCDDAMVCSCSGANGTQTLSVDAASCIATGRFGECLFEPTEYTGCSVAGDECAEACSLLWSRRRDEAVSAPSVSVRASACSASGQCRFVLESELGCVTGPELVPSDCTDAEAALTGP